MAAAMRRWACPNGCPGVLAPSKPRADDVRRYCLACSASTGRLVRRAAPSVERERAEKRARAEARRAAAREAERRKYVVVVTEVDGSAGELDVAAEMRRMLRLPSLRALQGRKLLRVKFDLRRAEAPRASGRAWAWRNYISLTIGPGVARERVEELILHEVVHLLVTLGAHHGPEFRVALVQAARELWPCDEVRAVRNEGRCYAMDGRLWRAARQAARMELVAREGLAVD